MLRRNLIVTSLLLTAAAQAQTTYPLGNGIEKWGVELKVPESEMSVRIGARLHSLATVTTDENLDTNKEFTSQDFQIRRVRFQFQANLSKHSFFNMDLRNDNANVNDKGERTFNIGDAYVQTLLFGDSHYIRAYRAKVDVSRTQTVSSSEITFVNRPYVADEAANFVSHNRRAANIQLVGHFDKKVSYQLVAGDGVYSDKLEDAKGEAADKILRQNFMVGAKVRFHPITGWEDIKVTETYFGRGKHLSFGAGAFNTSNINFEADGKEGKVSHNLINAEMSGHYGEWSFFSEYFKFLGVVEDYSAANFNKGNGEGWYAQGEKLFSNFHYLAPFLRYEKWNKFIESGDYTQESGLAGINWYLNGNRFRVSAAYQKDLYGRDISGPKERAEAYHIASMWHF